MPNGRHQTIRIKTYRQSKDAQYVKEKAESRKDRDEENRSIPNSSNVGTLKRSSMDSSMGV
jgi:hypothetical protein